MRLPSDAELNKKKSSFFSHMDDLCNISHVTMSSGTYGNTTETLTMVSGVACGIEMTNGQIRSAGQVLLVSYDALLTLPADEPVRLSDEITLVEKGNFQISGTFRPESHPIVNAVVQIVRLKRVTT